MTDQFEAFWSFYQRVEGSSPAAYNIKLANWGKLLPKPEWLVEVVTTMISPGKNGLGDRAESGRGDLIGDAIERVFVERAGGLLVARRRGDSLWNFYTYSMQQDVQGSLQDVIAQLQERGITLEVRVSIHHDPLWNVYWQDLFPHRTMDSMQVVIWQQAAQLRLENENPPKPHAVNHFVYLKREIPSDPFLAWARESGFKLFMGVSPRDPLPEENESVVCLQREEQNLLQESSAKNAMYLIVREAEKIGGRYVDCQILPFSAQAGE
jgi:hypothetical protein